jgi:hypothetical protein
MNGGGVICRSGEEQWHVAYRVTMKKKAPGNGNNIYSMWLANVSV